MSAKNSLWDKKAKTYQKFSQNISEFQKKFFSNLENLGVDFKNKTLLDIGCGTGVYTLHLAKFCKEILAIDSSKSMLDELNNSMQEFNIKNVITKHTDFKNFVSNYKFDIAFLTMSPALQNENDFLKFNEIANTKIYMNWAKPRNSSLLALFDEFSNKQSECFCVSAKLENFLKENRILYNCFDLNDNRVIKRNLNDALENILWHFDMNKIVANKEKIKEILKNNCKDGVVLDEIKASMKVFVF